MPNSVSSRKDFFIPTNMTYAEKLKNPKWQKRRLEILNRDEFTCQMCGDKESELHIHHEKYTGEPWEAHEDTLRTICFHCHAVVELLKDEDNEIVIRKVLKYETGAMDVALVCILEKGLAHYSICFLSFNKHDKKIDQIMSFAPATLREIVKEMDTIKSSLNPINNGEAVH